MAIETAGRSAWSAGWRRGAHTRARGLALAVAAGLLAGGALLSGAAAMTVKTVAPAEPVYLGQVFACYVVVEGAEKPSQPELFSANALETRLVGEHAVEDNGVKRWTFTFECLARAPGEVAIAGTAGTAGGKTVSAEPVTIEVRTPAETDKMSLKVTVSDAECYEGEAVLLTFEWHSELFLNGVRAVDVRLPALNDPRLKTYDPVRAIDPNDANAIGVPVENRRIIAALTENRRGDTPLSDIRFDQIIVPRSPGTLTIPGSMLICSYVPPKDQKFSGFRYPSYFNNDFFDKNVKGAHERYLVRSEPFTLKVKALPLEGRPESFGGIVGRIALEVDAHPKVATVSDPITLTLRVSGHPYPHTLLPPDLAAQSALGHSFDLAPEAATSSMEGGLRVFSQVIRPLRPNVKAIPAIRIGYFDPEANAYGEAVSDPVPVTVSAAVKVDAFAAEFSDGSRLRNEVERSPAGIYANHEGAGLLREAIPASWPGGRPWFWLGLLLGPPAMFALLVGATRRMRFARRDPDGARARHAYAVFLRTIHSLRHAGKTDAPETVAMLQKAVNTYVADRFGLSRGAASSDELARLLRQRRVDRELIRELEIFWDHASSMQFSRGGRNGSHLESAARQIPEAVGKIERTLAS